MYYVGLDIGAMFTKAAVIDERGLKAYSVVRSGDNYQEAVRTALREAFEKGNVPGKEPAAVTGITGFGSSAVAFQDTRAVYENDINCVVLGVSYLFPGARTAIEVGAQVSKVMKISDQGKLLNFAVGDRCAGGSGRFLQVMARVLAINFEDIGRLSLNAKNKMKFTTSCAVFTESEAISRIAEGALPEDILAGVHEAMAGKITSLLQRVKLEEECVFCGGGAKDMGLVKVLEEKMGIKLFVPEEPLICGAIGAAVIARRADDKIGGK